jgi:response regulator RpfG family c-di-GMP phosphodiesterase
MLLTGFADQQSAIDAINDGNVFRFLSKPCSRDDFAGALTAGIRQYRLVMAEKELLEGTLRGSIEVLTELLSLTNPLAFGRTERVKRTVRRLTEALGVGDIWRIEVAALLSQLGCITLPESVLTKLSRHEPLTRREQYQIDAHPRIAANLIQKIPRLTDVAEIVAFQNQRFDGSESHLDDRSGDAIPIGARILKTALDYDELQASGKSAQAAYLELRSHSGWYDPQVLDKLESLPADWTGFVRQSLPIHSLREGMILDEDLSLPNGLILARQGFRLTEFSLIRLTDQFIAGNIKGTIEVHVPVAG